MWLPLTSRTRLRVRRVRVLVRNARRPGPGGVDQRARAHDLRAGPPRAAQRRACQPSPLARGVDAAVRVSTVAPRSAASTRVEHDQARIVDPAVGIDEAAS